MAKEDFISVVGDDWYQRRRDDPEGKFFRQVADQGPRKGEGGSTRQGIYCFTAAGKLLAYKNHQDAEVMRGVLKQTLEAWNKLPGSERRPGAVKVETLVKADPRYSRRPPSGGLVMNVQTRILNRDAKGDWCKGTCQFIGGDRSARDHLWVTRGEWKALIPAHPTKGDKFSLPDRIADRLVRFHLVDNTRGEPPMWKKEEIRSRDINLIVEEASTVGVRLRLEGSVLLATRPNIADSERGYDVRLLGYLNYDGIKKTFDRFDIVAVGDHWGEGQFNKGARPGRTILSLALELARGDSPGNQVPPQGARDMEEYFGPGD